MHYFCCIHCQLGSSRIQSGIYYVTFILCIETLSQHLLHNDKNLMVALLGDSWTTHHRFSLHLLIRYHQNMSHNYIYLKIAFQPASQYWYYSTAISLMICKLSSQSNCHYFRLMASEFSSIMVYGQRAEGDGLKWKLRKISEGKTGTMPLNGIDSA